MVVDKPPHLIVHPTRPDGADTLLTRLEQLRPNQFLALINRLDRETSGLILVAKTREAASSLGKQMMQREIKKGYETIVWGKPKKDFDTIAEPLGRLGSIRDYPIYVKQAVMSEHEGGQKAVTHYNVRETREDESGRHFTRLSVEIDTGRLHQIRVHLRHMGCSVVGDKLYGPDDQCYLDFIETGWTEKLRQKLLLPRQALHAGELFFSWGEEGVRCKSELPEDLQTFWDQLRSVNRT